MKLQARGKTNISFPFYLYWRQLFSSHSYIKLINPFSFWHRYKIEHLETCWELNIVRFLERCYQLNEQPTQQNTNTTFISNVATNGMYRSVPWETAPQNTLLISQPNLELKYRGVTYRVNGILGANTNKISINYSQIITNNSKKEVFPTNNSINP